jgi:GTP cyclohydrolase II
MTKDEAIEWLVEAIEALHALKDFAQKSALVMSIRAIQRGGGGTVHLAQYFAAEARAVHADAMRGPEWSSEAHERDYRVLSFCAAVLRATVEEEQGPDLATVGHVHELGSCGHCDGEGGRL